MRLVVSRRIFLGLEGDSNAMGAGVLKGCGGMGDEGEEEVSGFEGEYGGNDCEGAVDQLLLREGVGLVTRGGWETKD